MKEEIEKEYLETFKRIKNDVESVSKIDDLNAENIIKKYTSTHMFWVGRLADYKFKKNELEKKKKNLKKDLKNEMKVNLSRNSTTKIISNNEIISDIDEEIELCNIMIDYLSNVIDVFKQGSYNLQTFVNWKKLEMC